MKRFLLLSLSCWLIGELAAAQNITVVDLSAYSQKYTLRIAVFAAAGLENREGPSVYVTGDSDNHAQWWLENMVATNHSEVNVAAEDFVRTSATKFGCVLYDINQDYTLHAVMTYAGVLGAVPLDLAQLQAIPDASVVLNTTAMGWKDATEAIHPQITRHPAHVPTGPSRVRYRPNRDPSLVMCSGGDVREVEHHSEHLEHGHPPIK